MGKIITVAHSKGGTGKTTTALQLAGELGITTLVDLDRTSAWRHSTGYALTI